MANGHGGHRNGAGRKGGRPDARTSKVRALYQSELAAEDLKLHGRPVEGEDDEKQAVRWLATKRRELYEKAVSAGDGPLALQVLEGFEDRCFGKPRQQLELAGDPDNPLGLKVSPGFYRAQFADGLETPASAAAAGASAGLPPPRKGKPRRKVKRRS